MYKQFFLFLFLLGFCNLNAQTKYSRVKIDLTKTNIQKLNALGLETDHGFLIPGVHFVNEFSDREIGLLKSAGIEAFVLEDDVQEAYKEGKTVATTRSVTCQEDTGFDYQTPENYSYGSMGGYHTFDEMLVVLEEMRTKFPNLITPVNAVEGIKTWEDNDIVWMRISDNPDVDEEEPEVLYTALHHAREPNGLSQMIFYMWYLLENYESDPQVKYLVDNTEMYFMPCLNPDGYKYNELTDPDGGGFWRKNRRPEPSPEEVGVDLNRNYGYFWGFDNTGSSPNKTSSTYRGPQAFSEPETQAVRQFCIEHNFLISLNYHTFGNLLIHPWGYNDQATEEDSLFKAMGNSMIAENNYVLGTGTETVGYVVNGDSDDYLYGEEAEKNKIYSFTPEVGPRFWPQQSEIDQLNKACMLQNLHAASLLLNHYDTEIRGLEPVIEVNNGSMSLHIVKSGLKAGGTNISIQSNNPDVLTIPNNFFIVDLDPSEQTTIPLDFIIANDAASLEELSFNVITNAGGYERSERYDFTYRRTVAEEEDLEDFTTLAGWENPSNNWGLTEEYFVSGPTSLTDSPNSSYGNERDDAIELMNQISIDDNDFTSLKFSARWEIELNYDYVLLQASTDNGETWTSLCGRYTRSGVQSHGTNDPLYDGMQSEWIEEEVDLTDYQGQIINLRLYFFSDGFVELDGFYIDDMVIVRNTLVSTSTEDELAAESFTISPSLNDGNFDVHLDLDLIGEDARLEVMDVQGRLIKSLSADAPVISMKLSQAEAGIYVVRVSSASGKSTSKRVSIIR